MNQWLEGQSMVSGGDKIKGKERRETKLVIGTLYIRL